MECDDEGFVSPTRVLRLYGGEFGDIKNLVDVGLVIRFKTGVLVITDWNQNNYLDKLDYVENTELRGSDRFEGHMIPQPLNPLRELVDEMFPATFVKVGGA